MLAVSVRKAVTPGCERVKRVRVRGRAWAPGWAAPAPHLHRLWVPTFPFLRKAAGNPGPERCPRFSQPPRRVDESTGLNANSTGEKQVHEPGDGALAWDGHPFSTAAPVQGTRTAEACRPGQRAAC